MGGGAGCLTSGGNTSFAGLLTATGGLNTGAGGTPNGFAGYWGNNGNYYLQTNGGGSIFGQGGIKVYNSGSGTGLAYGYGAGAGSCGVNISGAGGGGWYYKTPITVTSGNNYAITIGANGSANATPGIAIIEY